MQTNFEDIYACGDCSESYSVITGGSLEFRGILGTGIFKVFDLAYVPPYSTTKDPVMYTGMILDNAINKRRG